MFFSIVHVLLKFWCHPLNFLYFKSIVTRQATQIKMMKDGMNIEARYVKR